MSRKLILLFTTDINSLDKQIQEELYTEFYQLVFHLVFFIVRDISATEDIIQESFMRVLNKPPKILDEEKIGSWIKKVTRNVALNYLRKFKKMRDELTTESVFIDEMFSPEIKSVESQVEGKILEEAIISYIDQLKPEYRLLIFMKYIQKLSYKDIAIELGLTEGTLRMKLFRARETIKDKLYREWGIEE